MLVKLSDVQGIAYPRYNFGFRPAADGCAGPVDAGCDDPRDHLDTQWSGFLVG